MLVQRKLNPEADGEADTACLSPKEESPLITISLHTQAVMALRVSDAFSGQMVGEDRVRINNI